MTNLSEILQQYWGYPSFRPLQEDIIHSILDGKDTLALLPTGGGKSICFQVPALAKEGICLVVSPLIALMKDQVENLKRKDIPALSIYSGMSFLEVKKTLQNAAFGNYKFLYLSPERLETNLFLDFLPSMNISLIAVDEAHCISQWGYDFRPPYLRIAALREHLPNVPVLALTASATQLVQEDICEKLCFGKTQQRFQQSFERANLSYSAFNVPSKQNKLLEILQNVKGSAIVYCKSRKQTKDVAELLLLNKINADYYHAGLSNDERNLRQEKWVNNTTRVIVCTNAFGMGIDKPNVRVVVHYGVPDCLENYYQEAGRAGRDGKRAYAALLYNDRELEELKEQANIRFPEKEEIKKIYTGVMNHLQIAAGSGEGSSYNFDLTRFSSNFSINILKASYGIKALEQENIFSVNDVFFKPSTVIFTCSKEQINDFEREYPQLDVLVKGLLRSYVGIFDYPTSINENKLARFINSNQGAVVKELQQLQQFGIIAYEPQKDSPQITLLQNRMYADSFVIDLKNYLLRKKQFQQRVDTIIDFVKQTSICRSQMVAIYFNDSAVRPCKICDNCINKKTEPISKEEFDSLRFDIIRHVDQQPHSIKELLKKIVGFRKEKIWVVVNFLQSEQIIVATNDGRLTMKK